MTQLRRKDPPAETPSTLSINTKNLLTIAFILPGLWYMQDLFWDFDGNPSNRFESIWQWFSIVWAITILNAIFGLIGMVTFRRPKGEGRRIDNLVSFRYVSRGSNPEVLRGSILSCYEAMRKQPLFDYVIEVITDIPVDLSDLDYEGRLRHYIVPDGWTTPNGTKYKARGLQWGVLNSEIPEDAWILHGDEESCITESLVSGISRMVAEEEESGRHRIGQGIILYWRGREKHPLLTCADSIRTGDDYARFAFQCRIGIALFGFHGSNILVRNSVEKEVGFDFGPYGSVTEDAWWALVQMDRGRRCRFFDGYMIEQAPHSIPDFIRQRRRWFVGLTILALRCPVRLRYRLPLLINTAVWSLTWCSIFYTTANFFVGVPAFNTTRILGDFVFTYYLACYVIGMRTNLRDHPAGFWRSVGWYVGSVLLSPVYGVLEGAGVLYGILRPNLSFHVVTKDGGHTTPGTVSADVQAGYRKIGTEVVPWTFVDDWLFDLAEKSRDTDR